MSEAIIARRRIGNGGGFGNDIQFNFGTTMITTNGYWTFLASGNYRIDILGGGGGGGYARRKTTGGGGSGYYNSASFFFNGGDNVYITIGKGGNYGDTDERGETGGTTSFGTYLYASGGTGGADWDFNPMYGLGFVNGYEGEDHVIGDMYNGVYIVGYGGAGGAPSININNGYISQTYFSGAWINIANGGTGSSFNTADSSGWGATGGATDGTHGVCFITWEGE